MNIVIRNTGDMPIYEQIVVQIKQAIVAGELTEGEALPSMRLLAKELRISLITTKRAYEELEREGFIVTMTGRGSFVAAKNLDILREEQRRRLEAHLADAVDAARAAGVDYGKAITYSASHATYYPGAHNMTVKTLYDPATGRILGAQIVGFDGVDKRMDVLATAIRAGLTAADLTELDLAYAPPYGSAKDPVNMAGYVIENLRAGRVEQHHWDEVAGLPADGSVVLLDVRTPGEVKKQGLLRPDAVHIPLDELRDRLGELDPAKKIYVNCFSGLRSYLACRILSQHGYRCSNLAGGWRFWSYNATDRAHDAAPTHLCGIPTGQGK